MVRDDAMLAFERHATSKIKDADDLLTLPRWDFAAKRCRPSRRSRACGWRRGPRRKRRAPSSRSTAERLPRVEEAGLPLGTSITVRDLFFNTAGAQEISEVGVDRAFAHRVAGDALCAGASGEAFRTAFGDECLLVAPPVAGHRERVYQVFGKETLDQLIPLAAVQPLERSGTAAASAVAAQGRTSEATDGEMISRAEAPGTVGEMRLHGFVSKPEIQKLNRNSIFVFVNGRLIRDRLVQHALTEAYRNIHSATVFPVVLLFLEMPSAEVDVNVHPSKTEVRFRQQSLIHDFVRDSVRAALMKARPVPQFMTEIEAQPDGKPLALTGPAEYD